MQIEFIITTTLAILLVFSAILFVETQLSKFLTPEYDVVVYRFAEVNASRFGNLVRIEDPGLYYVIDFDPSTETTVLYEVSGPKTLTAQTTHWIIIWSRDCSCLKVLPGAPVSHVVVIDRLGRIFSRELKPLIYISGSRYWTEPREIMIINGSVKPLDPELITKFHLISRYYTYVNSVLMICELYRSWR
ncbi:MAG: hypothetical protein DRJ40_10855 [Thermoprotei archaeon]|nr:MAG: hypothetical protein DRJ40_10855 [Thermoprotei archaeon]